MTTSGKGRFWVLVIGSIGLLLWFNARLFPSTSLCWFKATTGYNCPGCGSQRALEALILEWDVFLAFALHPLLTAICLMILPAGLLYLIDPIRTRHWLESTVEHPLFKWVVLLTVLIFTILRNI